jgi:hypothetical protein
MQLGDKDVVGLISVNSGSTDWVKNEWKITSLYK